MQTTRHATGARNVASGEGNKALDLGFADTWTAYDFSELTPPETFVVVMCAADAEIGSAHLHREDRRARCSL